MHRTPLIRLAAALALLPAGPWSSGPLQAAEPRREPLPRLLTEKAAVDWATRYNDRVLDARSRVEERLGERMEARRWLPSSPRVGIGANMREAVTRGNLEASVNLRQEFWFGGKRALTMRIARAHLRAEQRTLKHTRTHVAAETRRAFYQLLAERQAVSGLETVVERLRSVTRALQERQEESQDHRVALNQARIAQGRAQAELAGARRRQERARLELWDMLSVSPPQPSRVEGTIPNRPLATPEQETLLSRAVHKRRDLQAAEQDVDAYHQQRRLVGREVIPNPSVSAQYRTEEGDRIGGLGISLGLPSFASIRGNRRQADARLEQAQRRRDALRRRIRREVLGGIADYRAARRQLAALSPRTQERARVNLRLVEKAAKEGELQAGRIGTVLDSLLTLRTARQRALDDLIGAAVDLEKATGGLVVMGRYREPEEEIPGPPLPEMEESATAPREAP